MPKRVHAQVVVLNGGSSSGKTSVARAMQEQMTGIWLTFGVDTFIEALPGRGDSPQSGVSFDSGGAVLLSEEYTRLENAWYSGLKAMVSSGANIILDEVLLSGRKGQERLRSAFGAQTLTWVGVRCNPDVAAVREAARGDRVVGMARRQATVVHTDVSYDVEVDTTAHSPEECARIVVKFLRAKAIRAREGSA